PAEAEAAEVEIVEEVAPRRRFFERLGKARAAFTGALAGVFARDKLTDEAWDDLEEALIAADVGIETTTAIVDDMRARAKESKVDSPGRLVDLLKDELKARLDRADRSPA